MLKRRTFRLELPECTFTLGPRTLLMGVLNVTPDSFSDGGKFLDPQSAIEHALEMERAGADLLDIGGESTRPGSTGTAAETELARILPVLEGLRGALKIPIAVDTRKSQVAEAAISAGAQIINDISGLRFDPRIAEVAHRRGVPRRCATSAMRGSKRRPEMSLMICAPALMAASATCDLRVSTAMGIFSAPRKPSNTGRIRASSVSAAVPVEPGRVDSPPMSSRSAPARSISKACSIALCGSRNLPPSEKLSGVTLSTPMTSVRSPSTRVREGSFSRNVFRPRGIRNGSVAQVPCLPLKTKFALRTSSDDRRYEIW